MQEKLTAEELHKSWEIAGSTVAAALSLKKVNRMSIAVICVALVSAAGPLLQKAVTPGTYAKKGSNRPIKISLPQELPIGFTGAMAGNDTVGMMTLNYTTVDTFYTGSAGIGDYQENYGGMVQSLALVNQEMDKDWNFNYNGFDGIWNVTFQGAGFTYTCDNQSWVHSNLNGTGPHGNMSDATLMGTQIFGVTIGFSELDDPNSIHIGTQWKGGSD